MIEQLKVSPNIPSFRMRAAFGVNIEFDKDLAPFSSFKTGGPARYFFKATTAGDVVKSIRSAIQLKIPFFVIGGGSNLLVSDAGYDGLIIKVEVSGLKMLSEAEIECGAGEDLMSLVNYATENSLTGIEFASGIKGTVGGAIYGNAGAYGGEMKDILTEITLVSRKGDIKTVGPDYCGFEYRQSFLKVTGEVVVQAKLVLQKGDKEKIRSKVAKILAIRSAKHPTQGKSAGSFFKNIPDPKEKHGKLPAGRLLEAIGAKSLSVGGAVVYEKHANMIINTGNATSKDIRNLADMLKRKVYEKFGVTLEEEVIQLGKF